MATETSGLRDMKVDDLRKRAREMDVSGASSMKKDELIAAIEKAGGAGGRGTGSAGGQGSGTAARRAGGAGDMKAAIEQATELHREEERLVKELHTREREQLKQAPVSGDVRKKVEELIAQEERAIKDMHAQIRALMKDGA